MLPSGVLMWHSSDTILGANHEVGGVEVNRKSDRKGLISEYSDQAH